MLLFKGDPLHLWMLEEANFLISLLLSGGLIPDRSSLPLRGDLLSTSIDRIGGPEAGIIIDHPLLIGPINVKEPIHKIDGSLLIRNVILSQPVLLALQ